MLHRLIFSFLLITSFGIAQIGAMTHEISHYSDASAQKQQQDFNKSPAQNNKKGHNDPTPHNPVCEKCVSYAELGNIISSAPAAISLVVTTNLQISTNPPTHTYVKPRTYKARAPPISA